MQRYPKILWVLALLCVLGSGGAQAQPAGPPKDPPAQMPPLAEEVPPAPAEYVARSTRLDDVDTCFSEVRLARSSLPGQVAEPAAGAVTIRRLVLAVDASGSMAGAVRGERKMDAARRAVTQFLADLPPDVEVGLVVFGHRGSPRPEGRAASCASAETVAAIGPANRTEVRVALEGLRPVGWTPLAQGIEHAAGLFAPVETAGEQVLLVVSDGVETCGGDPVATARRLHGGPVRAVVNIIGFDIRDAERARLAAVAEAGGGRFFRAESGNELLERLREAQRENLRRATRARVAAGPWRRSGSISPAGWRRIPATGACRPVSRQRRWPC